MEQELVTLISPNHHQQQQQQEGIAKQHKHPRQQEEQDDSENDTDYWCDWINRRNEPVQELVVQRKKKKQQYCRTDDAKYKARQPSHQNTTTTARLNVNDSNENLDIIHIHDGAIVATTEAAASTLVLSLSSPSQARVTNADAIVPFPRYTGPYGLRQYLQTFWSKEKDKEETKENSTRLSNSFLFRSNAPLSTATTDSFFWIGLDWIDTLVTVVYWAIVNYSWVLWIQRQQQQQQPGLRQGLSLSNYHYTGCLTAESSTYEFHSNDNHYHNNSNNNSIIIMSTTTTTTTTTKQAQTRITRSGSWESDEGSQPDIPRLIKGQQYARSTRRVAADASAAIAGGSEQQAQAHKPLPPPVLVYHESARSIVFRDHLRRAAADSTERNTTSAASTTYSNEPNRRKSANDVMASLSAGGGTSRRGSEHSQPSTNNNSIGSSNHNNNHGALQRDESALSDSPIPDSVSFSKEGEEPAATRLQEKPVRITRLSTAPPPGSNINDINASSWQRLAGDLGHTLRLDPLTPLSSSLHDTVVPSEAGIPETAIAGYQPRIVPLPPMEWGPADQFQSLVDQPEPLVDAAATAGNATDSSLSPAELEVVQLLQQQRACVKTIKNVDWTAFLQRFRHAVSSHGRGPDQHRDIPPSPISATPTHVNDSKQQQQPPHQPYPFNSFVTSTSLLPPGGKKMRCFGTPEQYTIGVVFALPHFASSKDEHEAVTRTQTWSWPAGYSAKTEFNIDSRGRLINGRQEALVSLSVLRQYNEEYIHSQQYMIANKRVSGLNQIPYNEVFLRVGGVGRIANGHNVATGEARVDNDETTPGRSFERGVGLPVALFVRTAAYGHLMALLRTRSRLQHVWGEQHIKGIPLLLITPEQGVRVLTVKLQQELWKIASRQLNPFQNATIAHKTTIASTDDASLQQKVEELLELQDETLREVLTPEELARLAGGFGATDDSVATLLQQVMLQDKRHNQFKKSQQEKDNEEGGDQSPFDPSEKSHLLQDVVNEGLTAAVRASDYHTSRQLLILYSLVASQAEETEEEDDGANEQGKDSEQHSDDASLSSSSEAEGGESKSEERRKKKKAKAWQRTMGREGRVLQKDMALAKLATNQDGTVSTLSLPPPPPPPPLDTDRLRSATNSDGLLAVLGAAQVLKAMQDGSAKRRIQEVVSAVEEWVNYGEQSMAFRISSWYDQRAAQGDLKIATEQNSSFMAFVSNKAIANRKNFAQQLRNAISSTDFTDVRFLLCLDEILSRMHSPCLRLELLQYVLGLDNRYSVAHVHRSVELAATCLSVAYGASSSNSSNDGDSN